MRSLPISPSYYQGSGSSSDNSIGPVQSFLKTCQCKDLEAPDPLPSWSGFICFTCLVYDNLQQQCSLRQQHSADSAVGHTVPEVKCDAHWAKSIYIPGIPSVMYVTVWLVRNSHDYLRIAAGWRLAACRAHPHRPTQKPSLPLRLWQRNTPQDTVPSRSRTLTTTDHYRAALICHDQQLRHTIVRNTHAL